VVVTVFWSFPACFVRAAPAAGSRRSALDSEDERPEGWRGWRDTDLIQPGAGSQPSMRCALGGSVFMLAEDQSGEPWVRLPVIPSPRGWRDEAVRHSSAGQSKGRLRHARWES
jgi:hypothetical protein